MNKKFASLVKEAISRKLWEKHKEEIMKRFPGKSEEEVRKALSIWGDLEPNFATVVRKNRSLQQKGKRLMRALEKAKKNIPLTPEARKYYDAAISALDSMGAMSFVQHLPEEILADVEKLRNRLRGSPYELIFVAPLGKGQEASKWEAMIPFVFEHEKGELEQAAKFLKQEKGSIFVEPKYIDFLNYGHVGPRPILREINTTVSTYGVNPETSIGRKAFETFPRSEKMGIVDVFPVTFGLDEARSYIYGDKKLLKKMKEMGLAKGRPLSSKQLEKLERMFEKMYTPKLTNPEYIELARVGQTQYPRSQFMLDRLRQLRKLLPSLESTLQKALEDLPKVRP